MDDPTGELVAFLRACVDRDEAVAQGASPVGSPARWNRDCQHVKVNLGEGDWDEETYAPGEHPECPIVAGDIHIYDEGGHDAADADHIARHDPQRVLNAVQAKRALLDGVPAAELTLDALRAMALEYQNEPGWKPEWAPLAKETNNE